MSMSFYLVLSLGTPLQTDQINSDIAASYGIKFANNIDLKTHAGFLPIALNGIKTGIETYYVAIEDITPMLPKEPVIRDEEKYIIQ